MTDSIDVKLLTAAIILARELNYTRAAKRLNISRSELNRQIVELENKLCLKIFQTKGHDVEVTEPGQQFVAACCTFLAVRNVKGSKAGRRVKATCAR
jgi:DNA-binding transcriptional LysR family regulator